MPSRARIIAARTLVTDQTIFHKVGSEIVVRCTSASTDPVGGELDAIGLRLVGIAIERALDIGLALDIAGEQRRDGAA
jgi:hypothetical protein